MAPAFDPQRTKDLARIHLGRSPTMHHDLKLLSRFEKPMLKLTANQQARLAVHRGFTIGYAQVMKRFGIWFVPAATDHPAVAQSTAPLRQSAIQIGE